MYYPLGVIVSLFVNLLESLLIGVLVTLSLAMLGVVLLTSLLVWLSHLIKLKLWNVLNLMK